MKAANYKKSPVVRILRLLMNQIAESFETPQVRQFRRLKRYVAN
jgi:hypothetical protein